MRLEDYWGVGPKTGERLRESLGEAAAIEAIEAADVRALTEAGLSRGRATRILRRATGGAMSLLGTPDARDVYDELLSLASDHAVTTHAEDRIRVLTPLDDTAERIDRLDDVLAVHDAWTALSDDERTAALEAFREYDAAGESERAAVETALALREVGLSEGPFAVFGDADPEALREAAAALGAVSESGVARGVDDELDRLRDKRDAARELRDRAFDVLETVQRPDVRTLDDFEAALVEYVTAETALTRSDVRGAVDDEAVDATDFVSSTLRALTETFETRVEERETRVADELRADVAAAREEVDAVVAAVDEIALLVSLARFTEAHELTRPTFGGGGLAVVGARNLTLSGTVQPVEYAVGVHDVPELPADDHVAVLTGANSGGKTTLLETLCQVTVLASMGLPVPADRAVVGDVDTVVFHRRHASFNAGVLESTLKSVVPPLVAPGRTLMLVDEFEAITEPGRAADLLHGLVGLTVEHEALGVYVTHLAADLEPLPETARIDGIFAEGLTNDLELRVDYQPRFHTVGKSTPEFIVSRLVANARDRTARQGYETLAAAVGEEAVQRTLSDARWTPESE